MFKFLCVSPPFWIPTLSFTTSMVDSSRQPFDICSAPHSNRCRHQYKILNRVLCFSQPTAIIQFSTACVVVWRPFCKSVWEITLCVVRVLHSNNRITGKQAACAIYFCVVVVSHWRGDYSVFGVCVCVYGERWAHGWLFPGGGGGAVKNPKSPRRRCQLHFESVGGVSCFCCGVACVFVVERGVSILFRFVSTLQQEWSSHVTMVGVCVYVCVWCMSTYNIIDEKLVLLLAHGTTTTITNKNNNNNKDNCVAAFSVFFFFPVGIDDENAIMLM